jgi:hypothetical protein
MLNLFHALLTRYIDTENPNTNISSQFSPDLISAPLKLASLPTKSLPLPSRLEVHIIIMHVTMRRSLLNWEPMHVT